MSPANPPYPQLRRTENGKQLIVNGRPFLSLAGELHNSSLTSAEYMDTIWQKLVETHVNTVLGCVTWEMIEPIEGQFDFKELDKVILGARKHGLRLVLLWFGSFKNGTAERTKIPRPISDLMLTIEAGCRYLNLRPDMGQDQSQTVSSGKVKKGRRCPPDGGRPVNLS
jgi:hypothetical protein